MSSGRLYHNYLFFFGVVYYLILPLYLVSCNWGTDAAGFQHIYTYYDSSFRGKYLLIVLFFVVSFYSGSLALLKFIVPVKKTTNSLFSTIGNRDIFLFSFPFWLFGQFIIFKNADQLFQGYTIDYNIKFIGLIASLNVLFLFLFLYQKLNKKTNLFLLFSLIEFSVILLGQGSRMYVLIPIVATAIFMLDNSYIQLKKLFVWGGVAVLFFLFIGIYRLGINNVSTDLLLYIGMAEPSLTWISCVSMFALNPLPLFAFPRHFLSSFYNFIPTVIFPQKSAYILPLSLDFEAPLGATSIMVTIISDFGILGGCFMFFALGFLLTYIRFNYKGKFGLTYYYCCCGVIPFQLFRDGSEIVNKMFFMNLFIVPVFLLGLRTILFWTSSKKHI